MKTPAEAGKETTTNLFTTPNLFTPSLFKQSKQNLDRSHFQDEVELAWYRLQDLRDRLGNDAPSLVGLTKAEL